MCRKAGVFNRRRRLRAQRLRHTNIAVGEGTHLRLEFDLQQPDGLFAHDQRHKHARRVAVGFHFFQFFRVGVGVVAANDDDLVLAQRLGFGSILAQVEHRAGWGDAVAVPLTIQVKLDAERFFDIVVEHDRAVVHIERLKREAVDAAIYFVEVEHIGGRLRAFEEGFQFAGTHQRLLKQVGVENGNRRLIRDDVRQFQLFFIELARRTRNVHFQHAAHLTADCERDGEIRCEAAGGQILQDRIVALVVRHVFDHQWGNGAHDVFENRVAAHIEHFHRRGIPTWVLHNNAGGIGFALEDVSAGFFEAEQMDDLAQRDLHDVFGVERLRQRHRNAIEQAEAVGTGAGLLEEVRVLNGDGGEVGDTLNEHAEFFEAERLDEVAAEVHRAEADTARNEGDNQRGTFAHRVPFTEVDKLGGSIRAVEIILPGFEGKTERRSIDIFAVVAHGRDRAIGFDGDINDVEACLLGFEKRDGHAHERQNLQHAARNRFDNLGHVERTGNGFHNFVEPCFLLGKTHAVHVEASVFEGCRRLMRENFEDFYRRAIRTLPVIGTVKAHHAEQVAARTDQWNDQHIAVVPVGLGTRMHCTNDRLPGAE